MASHLGYDYGSRRGPGTAPSFTDAALTVGGRIGRNFSIVGMVPTLFLTLWAYALFASESWVGAPDLGALKAGFRDLIALVWLVLGSLVIALFLHPQRLSAAHHSRAGMDWHAQQLPRLRGRESLVPHMVAKDAVRASHRRYPKGRRVMPTRLGNTLRRIEDLAGRQQLDTTVRLCAVSALATVLTVAALLTDGLWLLVALVPYALTYLAYLAYRAATAAAERKTNKELMTLLGGDPAVVLKYVPPVTDDGQA